MAVIALTIPSDPQFMRLVRLLASGVGSITGLDMEEIEDFRVAVDEACTSLLAACNGSGLSVGFELGTESVDVTGTAVGPVDPRQLAGLDPVQLSFSERILEVVVDRHELRFDPPEASFELHKRVSNDSDQPDNGC